MNKPLYGEFCGHCGGRWHLTPYCPYENKEEVLALSDHGEALRAYPGSDMADDRLIGECFACHAVCGGFIDLREVSRGYNAIVCRRCSWRVLIPAIIETFGDLRRWASTRFQPIS